MVGLPRDGSRLGFVNQALCTAAPKCSGGRPAWLHAGGLSRPAGLQFSSSPPQSYPKSSTQGAEARDGAWVQVLLTAAGLSESGRHAAVAQGDPQCRPLSPPGAAPWPHHPPMSEWLPLPFRRCRPRTGRPRPPNPARPPRRAKSPQGAGVATSARRPRQCRQRHTRRRRAQALRRRQQTIMPW